MYPLTEETLTLDKISSHWATDPSLTRPEEEVLSLLLTHYWKGDFEHFENDTAPLISRRRLLDALQSAKPQPGIEFFTDQKDIPPQILNLDDGSIEVSLSAHLYLPTNESLWTPAILNAAYELLSGRCIADYNNSFLAGLHMQRLSRDQFAQFYTDQGYEKPRFWFGKGAMKQSTAKARLTCREWLKKQVLEPKKCSKTEYRDQAMTQTPDLSGRAFDDIWRRTVPDSWKKGGAPKKQN